MFQYFQLSLTEKKFSPIQDSIKILALHLVMFCHLLKFEIVPDSFIVTRVIDILEKYKPVVLYGVLDLGLIAISSQLDLGYAFLTGILPPKYFVPLNIWVVYNFQNLAQIATISQLIVITFIISHFLVFGVER
jgi:hypothetical protein